MPYYAAPTAGLRQFASQTGQQAYGLRGAAADVRLQTYNAIQQGRDRTLALVERLRAQHQQLEAIKTQKAQQNRKAWTTGGLALGGAVVGGLGADLAGLELPGILRGAGVGLGVGGGVGQLAGGDAGGIQSIQQATNDVLFSRGYNTIGDTWFGQTQSERDFITSPGAAQTGFGPRAPDLGSDFVGSQ